MSTEALWTEYERVVTRPLPGSPCALQSRSVMMGELSEQIAHAGRRQELPVLILGESGVGKGCYAASVHSESPRAPNAFAAVSCVGLDAAGLEAVLVGPPPGDADATGGAGSQDGVDGGTLYLSEIGALTAEMQESLHRFLESGRVRVAGAGDLRVDARVVASSSLDLVDEVNEGRFREDLYYRFTAMPITVPPVRVRAAEEVIELLDFVARTLAFELAGSPSRFTPQALKVLVRYPWPGNQREMRNVLERAMIAARGGTSIDLAHLPPEVRDPVGFDGEYVPRTLAELEQLHIERTLRRHRQNRTHAAIELGISRATLIKKIREYGLARAEVGGPG